MGLTGIQIFKLLPKTNCGECGVPTCLAFAMNLASGKAELEKCPDVSEEAKETLASESAPPIRPLTIGSGEYVSEGRRRNSPFPARENLCESARLCSCCIHR